MAGARGVGHTPTTRSRPVTPSHPSSLGWFFFAQNPANASKMRQNARRDAVAVSLGNHKEESCKTAQN